jgi:hypothetical protein
MGYDAAFCLTYSIDLQLNARSLTIPPLFTAPFYFFFLAHSLACSLIHARSLPVGLIIIIKTTSTTITTTTTTIIIINIVLLRYPSLMRDSPSTRRMIYLNFLISDPSPLVLLPTISWHD